ncbi:MAG TPA: hypothetical protein VFX86_03415 [Candidatus Saccharimonadales bacterium]|nr:hypothetical protein [Candidatus Saccharimonadales bacterium]
MMFERLKPHEDGGRISRTSHELLDRFGFYHKDKDEERRPVPPDPYTVIINGVRWDFKDEDTYLAVCEENPDYSCIVNLIIDEGREIVAGECIYDQPEIVEEMKRLGFGIVDESLVEARRNYNFYQAPGQEQANLN